MPKFAKQYKYFLGGRIIGYNVDIVSLIIQANSERDAQRRKYFLDELINIIELLTIHLRMASELKQLGTQKAYLYLSEKAVVLSKQAEGWKKYMPRNSQSA